MTLMVYVYSLHEVQHYVGWVGFSRYGSGYLAVRSHGAAAVAACLEDQPADSQWHFRPVPGRVPRK